MYNDTWVWSLCRRSIWWINSKSLTKIYAFDSPPEEPLEMASLIFKPREASPDPLWKLTNLPQCPKKHDKKAFPYSRRLIVSPIWTFRSLVSEWTRGILHWFCVFLEDILEATTKVNRKDNLQMIRFCKNLYPAMYSCFVHSGLVSIAISPTVLVPSLVVAPLLRTLKLQVFFLTLA